MNKILKNKFFFTATSISLLVLVLVLVLSPKKKVANPPLSSPQDYTKSSLSTTLVDLSQEKRTAATYYKDSIKQKLPLSVGIFNTSVGIKTSIDIYLAKGDPSELVRFEIFGLSYINKNELDEKKNPNVTAFKESYLKGIELLESQNIDPHRLLFIYSDKSYIRETTLYWIDKLGLSK